jgi:hypothetical protein
MRKIAMLAGLVVAGIYVAGYFSLNAAGVNRFLAKMEELSSQGDVDGVCDLYDDAASVSLDDRTPEGPMKLAGGKPELCAYLQQVLPLQVKLVTATTIERDNFKITRDWLHPWTAHVSYDERRTVTMAQIAAHTNMQSQDQLTLVHTLRGKKITRLDSVSSALRGPQI